MTRIDVSAVRGYDLQEGETAWPTLAVLFAAAAVHALSAWAGVSGLAPAWLCVLVCGACAYAQFTPLHDSVHKGLSKRSWLNETAGAAAGAYLFVPFEPFRLNHLTHHAHTNDPEQDPDYWVNGKSWLGLSARCATLLEYHHYAYFKLNARLGRAFYTGMCELALFWALFAGLCLAGWGKEAFLYWYLPAKIGSALLGLLFDYWPHRPHTERGRLRDTAILNPAWFDPFFLSQNVHLIHHLFPTVPWYRYRAVLRRLEPGLSAEAGGLIWDLRTAVAMLSPRAKRTGA